ncbi:MAG TPA: dipeptidase [Gaiellaceae bacterium]
MTQADAAVAFARANLERAVADLARFASFPSVSAQPERAADVRRCADWLAKHLAAIGLDRARTEQTKGNPIVVAEWRRRPGAPTLLVYGHYDVQPAEPLRDWQSPPFEPVRRGDCLVGRGVSDDKSQVLAHVKAIEAYLRTARALPLNVVCVFEGEEEIGSPSLLPFLLANRTALHIGAAVSSDGAILDPDRPALTYALRGQLALEVEARGGTKDVHAGRYGGAIVNALDALCRVVASLHDRDGHVAARGFYDGVAPLSAAERAAMARDGPRDAELLEAAGAPAAGEPGYSLYERTTARPALTVTGLSGGYVGAGAKSIVPARATAKLDCRLVPNQKPAAVEQAIRAHLAGAAPRGVRLDVRTLSSSPPTLCDPRTPPMRAAAAAYRRAFGRPAVLVRSGGTTPIVAALQQALDVPTALMGFGLPDDGWHGPNERVHLPTFGRAIETCIWFLDELARTAPAPARPRATAVAAR